MLVYNLVDMAISSNKKNHSSCSVCALFYISLQKFTIIVSHSRELFLSNLLENRIRIECHNNDRIDVSW